MFVLLQSLDAAKLGINLLGCFLANMAGVQYDEIGRTEIARRSIAERRQHIAHALAVIDVHLAAISLNKDLFVRLGVHEYRASRSPLALACFSFNGNWQRTPPRQRRYQ